mmetsp:Transcript_88372/g.153420  ORF Transcript_88372/g.153420 Transcript_88372/m.153420 type:complete len:81 (+) Transcript_88372:278-520(+)
MHGSMTIGSTEDCDRKPPALKTRQYHWAQSTHKVLSEQGMAEDTCHGCPPLCAKEFGHFQAGQAPTVEYKLDLMGVGWGV